MQTWFVAFGLSFLVSLLVIRYRHWHLHLSADDNKGVQKFHQGSIPRIGGVGVAAGVAAALGWSWWRGVIDAQIIGLLLAAVPAFMAGLAEDLTKKVGVMERLGATMLAAALGAWWLGALLPRIGVPLLDAWMAWWPVGLVVTVVGVAGLANAINIIDGFNGLASAVSALMFAAFGYVAWQLGDTTVVQICLAMIGALLGFFVWNYPRGLIFLGDGGAYFVGFVLAEVAVLLVVHHPNLSPWFCLLVCIYPVTETMVSIYRRRILRKMSPGVPDALHLHSLIYRRLIFGGGSLKSRDDLLARNSWTSPYLWMLALIPIVSAVLFWRDKVLLVVWVFIFVFVYLWLYRRLIQFRAPGWLKRRVG